MNNQSLEVFRYNETQIQVLGESHNPLFIAKEVCKALDISDVFKATEKLDEDEKLIRKVFVSGQNRNVICINEPGLYSLVLRSTKPEAKAFKRWITHEVLPSIRQHGHYGDPQAVRRQVQVEMARERLQAYLQTSDIWTPNRLRRLLELERHLSLRELALVFQCSKTSVKKIQRLYRQATGDFSDRRPDSLKPVSQTGPGLQHIPGLSGYPAENNQEAS